MGTVGITPVWIRRPQAALRIPDRGASAHATDSGVDNIASKQPRLVKMPQLEDLYSRADPKPFWPSGADNENMRQEFFSRRTQLWLSSLRESLNLECRGGGPERRRGRMYTLSALHLRKMPIKWKKNPLYRTMAFMFIIPMTQFRQSIFTIIS